MSRLAVSAPLRHSASFALLTHINTLPVCVDKCFTLGVLSHAPAAPTYGLGKGISAARSSNCALPWGLAHPNGFPCCATAHPVRNYASQARVVDTAESSQLVPSLTRRALLRRCCPCWALRAGCWSRCRVGNRRWGSTTTFLCRLMTGTPTRSFRAAMCAPTTHCQRRESPRLRRAASAARGTREALWAALTARAVPADPHV